MKCAGMYMFKDGISAWIAVRSSVVEYLRADVRLYVKTLKIKPTQNVGFPSSEILVYQNGIVDIEG